MKNDLAWFVAFYISVDEDFWVESVVKCTRIHTEYYIFEFTLGGKLRAVDDQFAWPRHENETYWRVNE